MKDDKKKFLTTKEDKSVQFLTTKEEAFARAVVETGSVASAYRAVVPYVDSETAAVMGVKYGRKPTVKARILELLETDKRTSAESLVEKLGEMTEAKKEVLDREGNIVELRDNPVRMDAIKTVLKIHDVIKDTVVDMTNNTVVIQMTPEEAGKMQKVVEQMKELNEKLGLEGVQDGEIVPVLSKGEGPMVREL